MSEEEENIRAFIAIELPKEVKEELARLQDELSGGKEGLNGVRWVRRDTQHLTLKFLGDTPTKRIEPLGEALAIIGKETHPFILNSEQVEIQGRRVVWVSLKESGELGALAERIEKATLRLGLKKGKRRFRGHLTLGRIKNPKGYQLLSANLKEFGLPPAFSFTASEMVFFSSTLAPGGAVHKPLKRIVFSRET